MPVFLPIILRNAEVGQPRPALPVDEDVLGFQVLVEDAADVEVPEGVEELADEVFCVAEGVLMWGSVRVRRWRWLR